MLPLVLIHFRFGFSMIIQLWGTPMTQEAPVPEHMGDMTHSQRLEVDGETSPSRRGDQWRSNKETTCETVFMTKKKSELWSVFLCIKDFHPYPYHTGLQR